MPAKNRIKQYVKDGFYHVYNRGVEKRRIFLDDQDYRVFLHLLRYYLLPVDSESHPLTEITGFLPVKIRPLSNLNGEVEMHVYCLMPNHFHLLLKQFNEKGMQNLIQRLLTTYSMYFNRRYKRTGHLFQGPYKAILVDNDDYLLHLSRYIHLNPNLTRGYLNQYPYSSYPNYIGEKKVDWLKTDFVSSFFRKPDNENLKNFTTYRNFIEDYQGDPKEIIGDLALEED